MMKKIITGIAVMTTFISNSFSTPVLEVFTPPEYCSTSGNELYLVGRTNAPLIEIWINDQKFSDVRAKDSIFHAHIHFGFGLNDIRVIPIISGEDANSNNNVSIEILSSPSVSRKFKRFYPTYEFHNNLDRDECSACHIGLPTSLNDIKNSDSCTTCHTELTNKKMFHNSSDTNFCVVCHGSLESITGFIDDEINTTNPCYWCHKDKIATFEQEYIHGPVAGGSCTICHDPHGSPYDKSLVSAQEVLCFSCHDFQMEMKSFSVQHEPFAQGKCDACHDAHATSNKWVLVKSSEEVCMECHSQNGKNMDFHSHPYNVKPKRALKRRLELSNKGNLECLSCHNPHASNAVHLLRTNEELACLGCHTEKQ